MSKTKVQISISLDGFVAGPDQSEENPLGVGGEGLHDWAFSLESWRKPHGLEGGEVNASSAVVEERRANTGAEVMGRGMFGPPGGGPWGDDPWTGWWGDEPPFHLPVFVVTHHEREPLMLSDTTFKFVTDGVASAVEQAKRAAGGKDVLISGGASVINQALAGGLVDELALSVVPILLGSGERLLDGLGSDLKLEQLRAVEAPGVAHLSYRVVR
jgi:dihydrofolate reductase